MMKRSAVGSVYDIPAPTEQKVPTSNTPGETKVVWHSDLTALVGPREEEARRKSPEMKLLYIISACLTIMVLWGIFREVHILVPKIFDSPGAVAQQDLTALDQIQTNARTFQADSVGVGGRREAKHLLEVPTDEFQAKEDGRIEVTLLKEWDKQDQTDFTGLGGRKTLPRGASV